jgi:hypothetical protein
MASKRFTQRTTFCNSLQESSSNFNIYQVKLKEVQKCTSRSSVYLNYGKVVLYIFFFSRLPSFLYKPNKDDLAPDFYIVVN